MAESLEIIVENGVPNEKALTIGNLNILKQQIPLKPDLNTSSKYSPKPTDPLSIASDTILNFLSQKYGAYPSNYDGPGGRYLMYDLIYTGQGTIRDIDITNFIKINETLGPGHVYSWINQDIPVLGLTPNGKHRSALGITILEHPFVKGRYIFQVIKNCNGKLGLFDAGIYDINTDKLMIAKTLPAYHLTPQANIKKLKGNF